MSNYIGNQPAFGEFKKLDSIVSLFNGSTTQFNLEHNSVGHTIGDATQLIVSLNGVIQEPGTAYTLGLGGGSIVFASAPASTDTCHIVSLGGVGGTTTPTDGSVTASKLDPNLKDYLEETFTADGTQTVFTLTRAAIGSNSLLLSVDGIVQPSTAYSVAGTTLTISPALPNTTNVRVVHLGVQSGVYIPAADSITSNQLATLNGNLNFDDNAKAVFGEGSDLQIYHDAGGFNQIVALNDHPIQIKTASENMIKAIPNSGVELYHNNSLKLAITSTGIDVTGTVTSTGLIGNATNFDIRQNTSDGSDSKRTRIGGGGDVISSRGAMIEMSGNEHGNGGMLFLSAGHGGAYSQIRSYTSNIERMRIDSSGNVGIGTGSIATNTKLLVRAATNQNFEVESSSGKLRLSALNDARSANVPMQFASSSFEFLTGNVLVGATTSNSANVGHGFNSDGFAYHTRDGGAMLRLNRLTSDGAIMQFQKDGTTVGSIGTNTNGNFQLHGSATSHVGLQFGSPSILPINNSGASSDNAVDLGDSNVRFKDLYLSGGIDFGGAVNSGGVTSSSNKLDDYEEGTWTPTQNTFSTWNSPVFVATYTKIGRQVTILLRQDSGIVGWSSNNAIGGLPFSVSYQSIGYASDSGPSSDNGPVLIWPTSLIYFNTSNNSENGLVLTATYFTND